MLFRLLHPGVSQEIIPSNLILVECGFLFWQCDSLDFILFGLALHPGLARLRLFYEPSGCCNFWPLLPLNEQGETYYIGVVDKGFYLPDDSICGELQQVEPALLHIDFYGWGIF